jgi:hypothetical protein
MERLTQQLDKLTSTVNDLSTFVQQKISATDAVLQQQVTAAARWLDSTWPKHEQEHVAVQARLSAIETAFARGAENGAAILALGLRLTALETLKSRGEGVAWLARVLLVGAGSGITLLLTHWPK